MRSPQHAARRNLRYGGAMPKITNIGTRRVVGAALRDLREQRGVTQTEVARRLGVSPSTVSVREAGNENGSLTVESLQAHLGALDAHLRLTVIDGVGDLEVVQATPALHGLGSRQPAEDLGPATRGQARAGLPVPAAVCVGAALSGTMRQPHRL